MIQSQQSKISINFERLKKDILDLAEIGKKEDQGIYRMALSPGDIEGRDWLRAKIIGSGLEYFQDGALNQIGTLYGEKTDKSWVIGSHIDTVPAGGHLDGALGVLTGLEVLRTIQEHSLKIQNNLDIVAFTDEEGRFGGLFGSEAFIGELTFDKLHKAVDLSGLKITKAIENLGFDPQESLSARRNPSSLLGYIELHIEQGPVLDSLKIPIGIVEKITGLFKWQIRLTGLANHAGTTPMNMRKDAFLGLSEFSLEINRILEEAGSEHSVATIGRVHLFPGSANTVPGRVDFSLDVRDPEEEILLTLSDAFRRTLSAIARRRNLMFEFEILSQVKPAQSDKNILKAIEKACQNRNLNFYRMHSGAAHDAQILARVCPMGMIFVPSKAGKSHSPAEWTSWEDIEDGANTLLETILELNRG
jgi:N-carbamoyl-L-amino-acid hydrolase